ncbi:hypothetical protein HK103_007595 [Boothiomyces macroporosus]|uniref:Uncharacterized protein n=1 Tax=Boothiomyces macroporosus TaxID=261099 RepID=A0AAD5UC95_9FUNG|nr:hypothetical protein HK103_007595 [Boothiomyces macroporosus]
MATHSALEFPQIIERILLYSENLQDLSILNKAWNEISNSVEFRKKWLKWNHSLLEEWILDVTDTFMENNPFSNAKSFLANKTFPERCGRKSVDSALKDNSLVLELSAAKGISESRFDFWNRFLLSRGVLSGLEQEKFISTDLAQKLIYAILFEPSDISLNSLKKHASKNIWKAVELGNNEIVDAMQMVGIGLKWMDELNSCASLEITNTVVTKQISPDAVNLAMFAAYGGQALSTTESQKKSLASSKHSDGNSLANLSSSIHGSSKLASGDIHGSIPNLRKKTQSFILASADGKTYRAAPRTQTVYQYTKSNRIWESYTDGSERI